MQTSYVIHTYRKQIRKLAEVRKSSSAHSEHKKRQIIEMVRDETENKLREMAVADEEITGLLFPRGAAAAQRAQLYTGPLTKVGGGRPDSSDSETGRKSTEGSRRRFVRQMSDSSVSELEESEAAQDDGLR